MSSVIGTYEPFKSNSHVLAWKKISATTNRYLYRYPNGRWFVGEVIGEFTRNIQAHTIDSKTPFDGDITWMYFNGSAFVDDKRIKVQKTGKEYIINLLLSSRFHSPGEHYTPTSYYLKVIRI